MLISESQLPYKSPLAVALSAEHVCSDSMAGLCAPERCSPYRTELREQLQVFRRADTGRKQEEYQLLGTYELEPSSGEITKLFQDNQRQREQESRAGKAWWQS